MGFENIIYGRNSLKALVKGDNKPFCLPFLFCFLVELPPHAKRARERNPIAKEIS